MSSFGPFISIEARNVPREQAMFRGATDKDVFLGTHRDNQKPYCFSSKFGKSKNLFDLSKLKTILPTGRRFPPSGNSIRGFKA